VCRKFTSIPYRDASLQVGEPVDMLDSGLWWHGVAADRCPLRGLEVYLTGSSELRWVDTPAQLRSGMVWVAGQWHARPLPASLPKGVIKKPDPKQQQGGQQQQQQQQQGGQQQQQGGRQQQKEGKQQRGKEQVQVQAKRGGAAGKKQAAGVAVKQEAGAKMAAVKQEDGAEMAPVKQEDGAEMVLVRRSTRDRQSRLEMVGAAGTPCSRCCPDAAARVLECLQLPAGCALAQGVVLMTVLLAEPDNFVDRTTHLRTSFFRPSPGGRPCSAEAQHV
jgi:hypothetical protein